MKKLMLSGFLFMLITFSCENEASVKGAYQGNTVEIKYGETKSSLNDGMGVKLDSVLNDSRCPRLGQCCWMGNAEVRFIYSNNNESINFVLNTCPNFRTDTLIDGYRIKLVKLNPYPETGGDIMPEDYCAEILIIKE